MSTTTMRDRLDGQAAVGLVGRRQELASLLRCLEPDGPLVVQIHGIGGIGKTALLSAFAAECRKRDIPVVALDCRTIEPTVRGFLAELEQQLGGSVQSVEEAAHRLEALGPRVVVTLDTFEVFRLMDTWLRKVFLPAQSERVRFVFAGRMAPVSAWRSHPQWRQLFAEVPLHPLPESDALLLLEDLHVRGAEADQIQRFAGGHPLALTLGAAARSRAGATLDRVAGNPILELSQLFLSDVEDEATRDALEAASVVRRVTRPVLGAMLGTIEISEVWDRLQRLPVVELHTDGLVIHDTVRDAIGGALKAADPDRHRRYRKAAWKQLRSEVQDASAEDLWRYTADMLYLTENPVAREAFFPSGASALAVEPAHPEDRDRIFEISGLHEGPEADRLIRLWWERLPSAFHVVRDENHQTVGFYCMFDPSAVSPADLERDPLTSAWIQNLRREYVSRKLSVLFIRRWLGAQDGEAPSPVQAACWLDIKRTYMEMRPGLRRVYLPVIDLPTYAPVATELGFRPIAEASCTLDEQTYHTAMLDFGPTSVDGWLARIVAAELGVQEGGILDVRARQLVLDGRRQDLSPLEFELLSYLCENEGKACSRPELLEKVWGHEHLGASNVVDAVVRGLRKKLGDHADHLVTVRGVGYRFQPSG